MFSAFGHGRERDPVDDLEAEAVETAVLRRVVRHEPHRGDAEVDEDLRADPVLAGVDRQAEVLVRLDGVAALLLQPVGAHLVPEPDAAALVAPEVHDDALALGRDLAERGVELHAAVAAQRAEHVAGEALGVDPDEHVLLARDLAADERDVLDVVEERAEHVGGEVAVLRRDPGLGDPLHELLPPASVPHEIGDRDHEEAVLLGEHLELGEAGHGAVVVHDLGEHARRSEPREAGEVDRGLGVAGPLQHAALAVAQREDVTGPGEVVGPGLRVDERAHRGGAVGGRDAGRGAERGRRPTR